MAAAASTFSSRRNDTSTTSVSSLSTTRNAGKTTAASTSQCSWARVRKISRAQALEVAQRTSTKTSEYRLRMESVQWWRRCVEKARSLAWSRLVATVLEKCHEFLEYSQQPERNYEKEENDSPQMNAEGIQESTEDNQLWWQQFCISSCTTSGNEQQASSQRVRYPAEVLPIMVISSPLCSSCLVDRHAIATTIWNEWNKHHYTDSNSSTKCQNDDLVLFLPRLLPTLTDTLHLLVDGLATILKQHPYYSNYTHLLASRKKRKRTLQSSIQDWILEVMQTLPANALDKRTGNANPQETSINNNNNNNVNVVIVLQDDVASSNVVKQQFLQTLSSWRSLLGIPVSLVVLESSPNGPDGSLAHILRSGEDGTSGRFGRRVTYLSVPSASTNSLSSATTFPDAMALWSQYFLEALQQVPPPLCLPGTDHHLHLPLLEWTQQSIAESASCSRMADRLGSMIMEFFSQPGSFVWDSLRAPPYLDDSTSTASAVTNSANAFQPPFCTWFCVYEKAQALLSRRDCADASTKMMSSMDKGNALLQCRRYLQPGGQLHFWWSVACSLLPLHIWVLGEKQMMTQSQEGTTKPFVMRNAAFLLSHLARAYRLVTSQGSTTESSTMNDEIAQVLSRYLRRCDAKDDAAGQAGNKGSDFDKETLVAMSKKIGELVLLVNNFSGELPVDTSMMGNDITKGIYRMILDVNHVTAKQLDHWTRRWMFVNPLMKWMALEDPLTQSEDHESKPLHTTLNIRRDVVTGLDPAAQRLLGVLQDQMTIAKDDWFRAFGGTMEEFCIGLWTLQVIGLVQLKKGPGGGAHKVVYEKVSVVWC